MPRGKPPITAAYAGLTLLPNTLMRLTVTPPMTKGPDKSLICSSIVGGGIFFGLCELTTTPRGFDTRQPALVELLRGLLTEMGAPVSCVY